LKRFILVQGPDKHGKVRLEGDDYHYLVRVRRLAPGEQFPVLLPPLVEGGASQEALLRILSVENGVLLGEMAPEAEQTASKTAPDRRSDGTFSDAEAPGAILPPIILFQALPKGEKMDLIVRQAAEGGLAEIVPFASEFSVPRIKDGDKGRTKCARWERIIKEARQQSGSARETALHRPLDTEELFAYWEELKSKRPGTLGLIFHQSPLEQASLHSYLNKGPETVVLAIGPEGGFSAAEVSRFLSAGFKPLTIGDTVLRTETAALYAAAAVRIILLEKTWWEMKIPR
jgi:16S rRNA (uracil1498-N3)-methyltransferase